MAVEIWVVLSDQASTLGSYAKLLVLYLHVFFLHKLNHTTHTAAQCGDVYRLAVNIVNSHL